jgi:adsorption protein B
LILTEFTLLEWLVLAERELLLFAGIFFLLGAIDEFAVDICWLWMKLTGRAETDRIDRSDFVGDALQGKAALFIPAWLESSVIGTTLAHALHAWPQADLTIYIGCYRNDPDTVAAALRAAGRDKRVRIVIHDRQGPSTKADCLNRLYRAMCMDEERQGSVTRMVMLQDAEDMVDPAALSLADRALDRADFVQLPVLPEPQSASRWVGSHYCEEFAEAHGKAMVVRQAVGAAMPAAGVGCSFSRAILERLAQAQSRDAGGPFSVESLTEDYELGIRIKALGGRSQFLRLRGEDGRLVATRAFFPARLGEAVRQKTRWIHGIALQGWDRLGWSGNAIETWMLLRDRRGPLTALVLAAAYLLLILASLLWLANWLGMGRPWTPDPLIQFLLAANLASFGWRTGWRCTFTAKEYGWIEGLRAVLRIPVANIIAIMAGRRAIFAYLRTFGRGAPAWDKTHHHAHPAARLEQPA